MKKSLIVSLLLLIGLTGFAQRRGPQGTPAEQATRRVEQLEKLLSLKQAQKDSIYQVLLTDAKTREAAVKNNTGERPDMETMRAAMQKTNTKIKSFLTAEQVKKLEENQQQMMQRRAQREQN